MRWVGRVGSRETKWNARRILVGKPDGNRPVGRYGRRWEKNINIDLRKIGSADMDWIDVA
jgi:hypothetical protein